MKFNNLYEAGCYIQKEVKLPYVYKLIVNNETIYVGKSNGNSSNRMFSHLSVSLKYKSVTTGATLASFLKEHHFEVSVELIICETEEIARQTEIRLIRTEKGNLLNHYYNPKIYSAYGRTLL
jgi:GIY-YIG catalytic domain